MHFHLGENTSVWISIISSCCYPAKLLNFRITPMRKYTSTKIEIAAPAIVSAIDRDLRFSAWWKYINMKICIHSPPISSPVRSGAGDEVGLGKFQSQPKLLTHDRILARHIGDGSLDRHYANAKIRQLESLYFQLATMSLSSLRITPMRKFANR